jgi:hypothetical protein
MNNVAEQDPHAEEAFWERIKRLIGVSGGDAGDDAAGLQGDAVLHEVAEGNFKFLGGDFSAYMLQFSDGTYAGSPENIFGEVYPYVIEAYEDALSIAVTARKEIGEEPRILRVGYADLPPEFASFSPRWLMDNPESTDKPVPLDSTWKFVKTDNITLWAESEK